MLRKKKNYSNTRISSGQLKYETNQLHAVQNRVALVNESISFVTTLNIEKTTQEYKSKSTRKRFSVAGGSATPLFVCRADAKDHDY